MILASVTAPNAAGRNSVQAVAARFTQAYTWRELVALYGLTQPAMNLQPCYNIAPTATMIRSSRLYALQE
jgi:hypothetical protein